ncbi:hypothetical protein A3Q56_06400 [Intoshia linei]|uniref:DUF4371 domain-containing protein n=1 Tax=Intoshia linei TaxID=1819745 RepID=A0A177AWP1_9BILA|nr:hypothetical protein A3Q56_06400 [Intoshia linei]
MFNLEKLCSHLTNNSYTHNPSPLGGISLLSAMIPSTQFEYRIKPTEKDELWAIYNVVRVGDEITTTTLRALNGWFSCFQKRHNICSRVISGEPDLVTTEVKKRNIVLLTLIIAMRQACFSKILMLEHTFYQIVINLVENNGNVTNEFRAYDENDYSDDEFIDSLIPLIEEDTNHKDSIDYSTCSEIDIKDEIISRITKKLEGLNGKVNKGKKVVTKLTLSITSTEYDNEVNQLRATGRNVVQNDLVARVILNLGDSAPLGRFYDRMGQKYFDLISWDSNIRLDYNYSMSLACNSHNNVLLMVYVRYLNDVQEISYDLLFVTKLKLDTKGSTLIKLVLDYFNENNIPISNVTACTTDGAPAMIGRHRGDKWHDTLNMVINCVNKIKFHPLNHRIFSNLCFENDDEFQKLLMHTEVKWCSKGKFLKHFYNLYDSVTELFMKINDKLANLKCDVAYLADIFGKLNDVNLQLQGSICLIKAKGVVLSFIQRHDVTNFVNLNTFKDKYFILEDDMICYCSHLAFLKNDKRYQKNNY